MINNRDRNLPPRIMVVDDEKDILRIIKRDLESPPPLSSPTTTEATPTTEVLTQEVQDNNELIEKNKESGGESRSIDHDDVIARDAFMVETYTNGWNALEAINSHPPNYYDLVLTDIRMPRMNGFELYRKIKEKNPDMRIVFITAFEINKEEFSKVLPSIDVKDFIIKPISMTNLRSRLAEALREGHRPRDNGDK